MRRKIWFSFIACALLTGAGALADEQSGEYREQPGTMGDTGVTEKAEKEVAKGILLDEVVGIRPQLGLLAFKDSEGSDTSRFAAGLTIDWNMMQAFRKMDNMDMEEKLREDLKHVFVGPSTGVIFSHLGDASSNFFGSDANRIQGAGGANFLLVPLDLKVGYTFSENMRASLHGGGNLTYRSRESSIQLSDVQTSSTDTNWTVYPNIGASFEIGYFMIRPDWTVTPGNDVVTATVGFSIPLT